jgi:hypothetical protein
MYRFRKIVSCNKQIVSLIIPCKELAEHFVATGYPPCHYCTSELHGPQVMVVVVIVTTVEVAVTLIEVGGKGRKFRPYSLAQQQKSFFLAY